MSDDRRTPNSDEQVAIAQQTAGAVFSAGFAGVKQVLPNGTIVVQTVTPSDTLPEEEWAAFEVECGGKPS